MSNPGDPIIAGKLGNQVVLTPCWVPDDYIGTKIGSLLRAREIMELLVSTSVPENVQ